MDTSRWGLPVRRVERNPNAAPPPRDEWPMTVPAVAQLVHEGLDLGPATVLVGENGAGKSTVLEGIAWAFGLDSRGGSRNTRGMLSDDEPDPVGRALRVVRGPGAGRWGFFLRAETMHQVFETIAGGRDDPGDFHAMSHGEAFNALLGTNRYRGPGLYCFDEPESALSFTSQLALLAQMADLVATGTAQVLVATHSPLLAALPGARLLLVDDDGLTDVPWDALPLVAHWRAFMDDPRRYLRHL
ncbi:AAA family ATPase [Quadrisphaera granulorum]|nr:AAA family ATPase [Quadrisphaera granulorum]